MTDRKAPADVVPLFARGQPQPPRALRLRAEARTRINGVRASIKLLIGPAYDGNGLYGLVALDAVPGVALAYFRLVGNRLDEFRDADDEGIDRELTRVFGVPALDVRDLVYDLVADMITGMLVPVADQPGGDAVH